MDFTDTIISTVTADAPPSGAGIGASLLLICFLGAVLFALFLVFDEDSRMPFVLTAPLSALIVVNVFTGTVSFSDDTPEYPDVANAIGDHYAPLRTRIVLEEEDDRSRIASIEVNGTDCRVTTTERSSQPIGKKELELTTTVELACDQDPRQA